MDANSNLPEVETTGNPPFFVIILFNLVILAALAIICGLPPIPFAMDCIPVWGYSLSFAFIMLGLLHLAWRFILRDIKLSKDSSSAEFGLLKLPIEFVLKIFERLHLPEQKLTNRWLGFIFFLLVIMATLTMLIAWYPVYKSTQPPIIKNFLVSINGVDEQDYSLGHELQLPLGSYAIIRINESDQPGISCIWRTNNTNIRPLGCEVKYEASADSERDTLSVEVQSMCDQSEATYEYLAIEIVQDFP